MYESEFQKKVMDYLKKKGCYYVKIIVSNKKGTPDILGCFKGFFFAIECKRKYNKATDLQMRVKADIENNGGGALILIERSDYREVLDSFLNQLLERGYNIK